MDVLRRTHCQLVERDDARRQVEAYVAALVRRRTPLTPEQITRLRELLAPQRSLPRSGSPDEAARFPYPLVGGGDTRWLTAVATDLCGGLNT